VPLAVHEAGAALDRVIASRKDEDSAFLELRPGDVIQPAKLFVQETVNKYLSREVSPLLLRDEKFALEVCFVPKTLLGGLWLQFADAIDKNVTYRRCQQCGTPFAVGAGTARRTKLFCSDACKSLHYRQRQATARSLHAEGRSLADIARRLNTDTETVRGWIEKGQ
jgi:hypothetical protein